LARQVNRAAERGSAAQQEVETMNKLQNIAARQRNGLVRDALFVTVVAFAAIVSASTVTQAVVASAQFQHR
jgi:hypothetical protein